MVLVEQGYIGRNFEPEYRKKDMHAAYFIRAKGIGVLKARDDKKYDAKVLHNIYKDSEASEQFISDNLTIFDTYIKLKAQYGDKLKFFTKSDLYGFDHAHFPSPLPDAYIRLEAGNKANQFFFNVHTAEHPFFKMPKTIQQYAEHADSQIWDKTGESQPNILALCDKPSTQVRLQKRIAKQKHPDLLFLSAIKGALNNLAEDTNIWHPQAKATELTSLEATYQV